MDSYPLVVCILLNFHRRDDTVDCVHSLLKSTYPNIEIIVLDICSGDETAQMLRELFPDIEVIELVDNRGYAGNNNIGIRAAREKDGKWIFLLNEDTIIHHDTIMRLVQAGEEDEKIGILGPMVYHHNEPTVIQSAGGRLGSRWESIHLEANKVDQGLLQSVRQVDWISGCAIMVRSEMIDQVGLLDENFFCYWEETEWCLRARKAGWLVVQDPIAKLWHKGVQRNYSPSPIITYYSTRNRFLTMSLHRAPWKAWVFAYGEVFRTLISWSVRPKWRTKRAHRDAIWQGLIDFLRRKWGEKGI
jgi:GT2 family glycosyltransferase